MVYPFGTKMGTKLGITKEVLETEIASGMTFKAMSKIHGCSISSIHRHLQMYQLEYKDNRKKLNKDEVRQMVADGASNAEIAEKFGCSELTVKDFVNRNELSKLRLRKYREYIEERTESGGTICKANTLNRTARKCLYGGKCGNADCCDKLLLTGKRRRYDPENVNICYDFVKASEREKERFRMSIIGRNKDVLMIGKEG